MKSSKSSFLLGLNFGYFRQVRSQLQSPVLAYSGLLNAACLDSLIFNKNNNTLFINKFFIKR